MSRILNFHDVEDMEWFDMVITILKKKYFIVSAEDIESYFLNNKALKNACHITVDDGHSSFYNVIYPVLKKHNIPATVFVSPDICKKNGSFWFQEIDNLDTEFMIKQVSEISNLDFNRIRRYSLNIILKNYCIDDIWDIIISSRTNSEIEVSKFQNMNIQELIEIDRDGLVTIGAHTLNHPILANETYERASFEIIGSLDGLEEILGHKIKYFAYPNGIPNFDFGEREIQILKETSCKIAFSTEERDFTIEDNHYSVPRYGLTGGDREYYIMAKLAAGNYWDMFKRLKPTDERKLRLYMRKQFVK